MAMPQRDDTIEIDVSPSSVPISYHGIYHYRSGTTHQELTGIALQQFILKEHASRPRNKNIAAVFYRAGFIESWGRGIKKICKAFTEAGLPPPKFDEISNGTRITIERTAAKSIAQGRNADALNGALNGTLKVGAPLNDPLNAPLKIAILRFVKECPGVNRTRLVVKTGRNVEAVKRAISALVAMKRIERRGSKKTGGYYIVTEAES